MAQYGSQHREIFHHRVVSSVLVFSRRKRRCTMIGAYRTHGVHQVISNEARIIGSGSDCPFKFSFLSVTSEK